jgi:tRNA threonylcarbamoyladenosine biosynthesis protein TsaE
LLQALGVVGVAPPPSFAIVQPYGPPEVLLPVLHIDFYRLDDPAEFDELGLDEARWDSLLLVEWPEHGGSWADALALALAIEPDGARRLTARVPPAWEARWRSI